MYQHYENDKSTGLRKEIISVLFKSGTFLSGSSNVNTLKRLEQPIKPSSNKYISKNLEEANAIFEKAVIGYGVINSTSVNEQTQSSAKKYNKPLTAEGYSSKDTSVTNNTKDKGKSAELVMINGKNP